MVFGTASSVTPRSYGTDGTTAGTDGGAGAGAGGDAGSRDHVMADASVDSSMDIERKQATAALLARIDRAIGSVTASSAAMALARSRSQNRDTTAVATPLSTASDAASPLSARSSRWYPSVSSAIPPPSASSASSAPSWAMSSAAAPPLFGAAASRTPTMSATPTMSRTPTMSTTPTMPTTPTTAPTTAAPYTAYSASRSASAWTPKTPAPSATMASQQTPRTASSHASSAPTSGGSSLYPSVPAYPPVPAHVPYVPGAYARAHALRQQQQQQQQQQHYQSSPIAPAAEPSHVTPPSSVRYHAASSSATPWSAAAAASAASHWSEPRMPRPDPISSARFAPSSASRVPSATTSDDRKEAAAAPRRYLSRVGSSSTTPTPAAMMRAGSYGEADHSPSLFSLASPSTAAPTPSHAMASREPMTRSDRRHGPLSSLTARSATTPRSDAMPSSAMPSLTTPAASASTLTAPAAAPPASASASAPAPAPVASSTAAQTYQEYTTHHASPLAGMTSSGSSRSSGVVRRTSDLRAYSQSQSRHPLRSASPSVTGDTSLERRAWARLSGRVRDPLTTTPYARPASVTSTASASSRHAAPATLDDPLRRKVTFAEHTTEKTITRENTSDEYSLSQSQSQSQSGASQSADFSGLPDLDILNDLSLDADLSGVASSSIDDSRSYHAASRRLRPGLTIPASAATLATPPAPAPFPAASTPYTPPITAGLASSTTAATVTPAMQTDPPAGRPFAASAPRGDVAALRGLAFKSSVRLPAAAAAHTVATAQTTPTWSLRAQTLRAEPQSAPPGRSGDPFRRAGAHAAGASSRVAAAQATGFDGFSPIEHASPSHRADTLTRSASHRYGSLRSRSPSPASPASPRGPSTLSATSPSSRRRLLGAHGRPLAGAGVGVGAGAGAGAGASTTGPSARHRAVPLPAMGVMDEFTRLQSEVMALQAADPTLGVMADGARLADEHFVPADHVAFPETNGARLDVLDRDAPLSASASSAMSDDDPSRKARRSTIRGDLDLSMPLPGPTTTSGSTAPSLSTAATATAAWAPPSAAASTFGTPMALTKALPRPNLAANETFESADGETSRMIRDDGDDPLQAYAARNRLLQMQDAMESTAGTARPLDDDDDDLSDDVDAAMGADARSILWEVDMAHGALPSRGPGVSTAPTGPAASAPPWSLPTTAVTATAGPTPLSPASHAAVPTLTTAAVAPVASAVTPSTQRRLDGSILASPSSFFAAKSGQLGRLEGSRRGEERPFWYTPKRDAEGRFLDLIGETPATATRFLPPHAGGAAAGAATDRAPPAEPSRQVRPPLYLSPAEVEAQAQSGLADTAAATGAATTTTTSRAAMTATYTRSGQLPPVVTAPDASAAMRESPWRHDAMATPMGAAPYAAMASPAATRDAARPPPPAFGLAPSPSMASRTPSSGSLFTKRPVSVVQSAFASVFGGLGGSPSAVSTPPTHAAVAPAAEPPTAPIAPSAVSASGSDAPGSPSAGPTVAQSLLPLTLHAPNTRFGLGISQSHHQLLVPPIAYVSRKRVQLQITNALGRMVAYRVESVGPAYRNLAAAASTTSASAAAAGGVRGSKEVLVVRDRVFLWAAEQGTLPADPTHPTLLAITFSPTASGRFTQVWHLRTVNHTFVITLEGNAVTSREALHQAPSTAASSQASSSATASPVSGLRPHAAYGHTDPKTTGTVSRPPSSSSASARPWTDASAVSHPTTASGHEDVVVSTFTSARPALAILHHRRSVRDHVVAFGPMTMAPPWATAVAATAAATNGTRVRTQALQFTNGSSYEMRVDVALVSPHFSLTGGAETQRVRLAPRATAHVSVVFCPKSEGVCRAVMVVHEASRVVARVVLEGKGRMPVAVGLYPSAN
ncbi:hypothetical protein CXG81DRAFT_25104 [Caulochytrium protostelioides]|uniref:Abnormal spindle-like microcephaly-associated protein ASH domain-containing protein n=1 Tax=Caulochytrium protostelioides TaxID=1555241 RepID=A0A4P9XA50_9FUNG|nr:hypothetical protein CXG81DRAFT_25104 [Caulochytrium protostelioides]|eukprot:RKP02243.1 hypothetical protein CXG81DRAFT_25104 [Caulochytrium protostelioides]